jgi:hypothetical protein
MPFFRMCQHLLPDAQAWRVVVEKAMRRFFEGLSETPADFRAFADGVFDDLLPAHTRELAEWEEQFGLVAAATEDARRAQIAAAWRAQGGQSPAYLQAVVQAAGFPLCVHEWWEPADDSTRNPLDHTDQPMIGTYQCGDGHECVGQDLEFRDDQAQCSRFLVNEVGYLVNLDLTPNAPPAIPSDPDFWPHFIYFGGETFGDRVEVDAARRAELERLVLKICPAHLWIVMLVDYV